MKVGATELVKLRGALLLCVVLVAAGAAAVAFILKEKKQAGLALVTAQGQRTQSDTRLRQVSSEEQEIKEKSAQFQQLLSRGILGTENRLDWVELLREIRDRYKLYAVDYEIAPQQKLESVANGYEFESSSMRLDLRLLHEEDLLRLLVDLRRDAKALIVPRDCALSRLDRGASEGGGAQAQLKAECTVQWITVRGPENRS